MQQPTLVCLYIGAALVSSMLAPASARADLPFPVAPVSPITIDDAQLTSTACKEAEVYLAPLVAGNAAVPGLAEPVGKEKLNACYPDTGDKWNEVGIAASAFVEAAKVFYTLGGAAPPEGGCAVKVDEPQSITDAAKPLKDAQAAVKAADDAIPPLQKTADDLDIRVKEQQLTVDAERQGGKPRQALTEKLAEMKIALTAAQLDLKRVKDAAAAKHKDLDDAKAGQANAKSDAAKASATDVVTLRKAFHLKVEAALAAHSRDPGDFEAMLDNPDRLKACEAVRQALLVSFGAVAAKEKEKATKSRPTLSGPPRIVRISCARRRASFRVLSAATVSMSIRARRTRSSSRS